MLLALMLAAAALPVPEAPPEARPGIDGAGNRLEALALRGPVPAEGSDEARLSTGSYCTPSGAYPRWCVQARREAAEGTWQVSIHHFRGPMSDPRPRVFTVPDESAVIGIWPFMVREAGGGALFGLLSSRGTSYSGGGATVTRLILLREDPASMALSPVLDLPWEGYAMIRACFSGEDSQVRLDHCQDEYRFAGSLALDPDGAPGSPRFRFETRAQTFPGRVSRDEDSLQRPPLRRQDLVWWRDPVCSYRRIFTFDPGAGGYAADAPLPECRDYLDIGD